MRALPAALLVLFAAAGARAEVLTFPVVEQEQTMWCWSGTSRAVLLFHGKDVSQCVLASKVHAPADCCADPDTCNEGYDGVGWLINRFGADYVNVDHPLSATEVADQIAASQPFFIRWSYGFSGHWVVGHGLEGDQIHYMDPWMGEGLKIASLAWVTKSESQEWIETIETMPGCLKALEGSACTDHDKCTDPDVCAGTLCVGPTTVTCPAAPQCHESYCDPNTGACAQRDLYGMACDDGDACTVGETCDWGWCRPASNVTCPPPGQCQKGGGCDWATGTCVPFDPGPDGVACDDGSLCTTDDTCKAGECVGKPIGCGTFECHVAAGCDGTLGKCDWDRVADGTPCEGGACVAGGCRKAGPDAGTAEPAGQTGGGCSTSGSGATLAWLALVSAAGFGRRRRASAARPSSPAPRAASAPPPGARAGTGC